MDTPRQELHPDENPTSDETTTPGKHAARPDDQQDERQGEGQDEGQDEGQEGGQLSESASLPRDQHGDPADLGDVVANVTESMPPNHHPDEVPDHERDEVARSRQNTGQLGDEADPDRFDQGKDEDER